MTKKRRWLKIIKSTNHLVSINIPFIFWDRFRPFWYIIYFKYRINSNFSLLQNVKIFWNFSRLKNLLAFFKLQLFKSTTKISKLIFLKCSKPLNLLNSCKLIIDLPFSHLIKSRFQIIQINKKQRSNSCSISTRVNWFLSELFLRQLEVFINTQLHKRYVFIHSKNLILIVNFTIIFIM